ncbi:MAG TPA: GntR family transcriptional regulator [Brevibacterium sp.]|nr:GntR family transcriptional regulator [Brevibacterium sp.]
MRSDSLAPTQMLKRQALADQVYDRLMTDLIDGRLKPDSPMSIDGVARELGVSPTPVREALGRLESTGLVTRLPFKGYRVGSPLSLEDLRQLSDARRIIEPANARLAAAATTRELCEGLESDIADLKRAPRGPSFAEFRDYWEADERFHRRIAEHTGNRYLFRAYSALGGQLQRYRLFKGRGVTDFVPTLEEHTRILEAVRAGDVELAGEAMTCHIVNVWERSVEDSKNVP